MVGDLSLLAVASPVVLPPSKELHGVLPFQGKRPQDAAAAVAAVQLCTPLQHQHPHNHLEVLPVQMIMPGGPQMIRTKAAACGPGRAPAPVATVCGGLGRTSSWGAVVPCRSEAPRQEPRRSCSRASWGDLRYRECRCVDSEATSQPPAESGGTSPPLGPAVWRRAAMGPRVRRRQDALESSDTRQMRRFPCL